MQQLSARHLKHREYLKTSSHLPSSTLLAAPMRKSAEAAGLPREFNTEDACKSGSKRAKEIRGRPCPMTSVGGGSGARQDGSQETIRAATIRASGGNANRRRTSSTCSPSQLPGSRHRPPTKPARPCARWTSRLPRRSWGTCPGHTCAKLPARHHVPTTWSIRPPIRRTAALSSFSEGRSRWHATQHDPPAERTRACWRFTARDFTGRHRTHAIHAKEPCPHGAGDP